jgi:serine/threonine-protein kinase
MFEDRPFLVMELLEGESLYDLLSRVRRLDAETTLRVANHSARGLAKAHEANVIHRDLKPENIFITKNEEGEMVAKILDFGLAKFYEPTTGNKAQIRLTREGALFGTPAYMSPEQAKGQGEVDHRCDLWALGCIVYECLTGTTVWNVDQGVAMILAQIAGAPIPKPSKLRPDLSASFDQWFARALDRDVNKRYQTAKEFANSLSQALKPNQAAFRQHALSSDEEGAAVDALVSSPRAAPAVQPVSPAPPKPVTPPAPQAVPQHPLLAPAPISQGTPPKTFDVRPDDVMTMRPPAASPWRAISALFAAAAVALGGYALWLYVIHPARSAPIAGSAGSAGSAAPESSAGAEPQPLEREPYALQIASAQKWLYTGKPDNALSMFKEAFNNGGTNVARTMLAQAGAALENPSGKCRVTGLGRPRPFDVVSPVSRPTIAVTVNGVVAGWVDNHEDEKRKQAVTTLLDPAMRRVSPARLVTPEAESVRSPQLEAAGEKVALIYWEGMGKEPGVYARLLESDGRIASPARRLSGIRRHDFYPALTRAADKTFWATWEEEIEEGTDIMVRHLSADLEPLSAAVRVTGFARQPRQPALASRPDIAVAGGHLHIVFSVERNKRSEVMLLRVKVDDPGLATGLGALDEKGKRRQLQRREDRAVGQLRRISTEFGKNSQARIACAKLGCFAVWDDEKAGALAAFVDPMRGEALWHREFASSGSRPAVGSNGEQAAVAWYDGGRVNVATVSRDGVTEGSVVAKVGGLQPYPAIVPGATAGQWYISWRDYEAGHLEAFVVRAECQ